MHHLIGPNRPISHGFSHLVRCLARLLRHDIKVSRGKMYLQEFHRLCTADSESDETFVLCWNGFGRHRQPRIPISSSTVSYVERWLESSRYFPTRGLTLVCQIYRNIRDRSTLPRQSWSQRPISLLISGSGMTYPKVSTSHTFSRGRVWRSWTFMFIGFQSFLHVPFRWESIGSEIRCFLVQSTEGLPGCGAFTGCIFLYQGKDHSPRVPWTSLN
jgi:hypothetical protein